MQFRKIVAVTAIAASLGFSANAQETDWEFVDKHILPPCLLELWKQKVIAYGEPVVLSTSDEDLVTILKVLAGKKAIDRTMKRIGDRLSHLTVEERRVALKMAISDCKQRVAS